ncbi:hypothetical protein STCU_11700 [Strigomonas culicis]|uniref:Uncharacterized protein n=1 Tax=Strigomonas culicis TaxID=28005 RepID=S9THR4_9TRYP|nr:hypothetical protein STCU_11700 [Strigomonas culicis]|eukprot:EPY15883.1 hypothetical protein STCU_11700 [Strigomonas culicis]
MRGTPRRQRRRRTAWGLFEVAHELRQGAAAWAQHRDAVGGLRRQRSPPSLRADGQAHQGEDDPPQGEGEGEGAGWQGGVEAQDRDGRHVPAGPLECRGHPLLHADRPPPVRWPG